MYCSKCGTKINDDDLFCSKCGAGTKTDIPNNAFQTNHNNSNEAPMFGITSGAESGNTKPNNTGSFIWKLLKWGSYAVIGLIALSIFVAVISAFMYGMSSPGTVDTENPDTFFENSGGYSNVIVESEWKYEYNQYSNEKIIVNCYFDVTNIGTATADNVQVDYSVLFDGRVLETSTIYLGSIPAGSSIHREKGQSVKLTTFEWNDLIDEEEKIEVSIDEVRSE